MKRPPAKKSLGQHFIFNPSTIDKIIRLAHVGPGDSILEIGPGPGLMTRQLAERAARVVAVEKDDRLAAQLQEALKGQKNLTVIHADFLDLDLGRTLEGGPWKVVANLPYNIATEVVFHLLERQLLFTSFYLMLQREVGERFCAKPGGKSYGLPSVFTQILCDNRILMRLAPGAFTPPPKVHSVLAEFRIHETPRYDIHHLPTFEKVVRTAFAQRRKMIRNTLKELGENRLEAALRAAGIPPAARAETVSIDQFTRLANALQIS